MDLTHVDPEALANLIAEKVMAKISARSRTGRWLILEKVRGYARARSRNTILKWIRERLISWGGQD